MKVKREGRIWRLVIRKEKEVSQVRVLPVFESVADPPEIPKVLETILYPPARYCAGKLKNDRVSKDNGKKCEEYRWS